MDGTECSEGFIEIPANAEDINIFKKSLEKIEYVLEADPNEIEKIKRQEEEQIDAEYCEEELQIPSDHTAKEQQQSPYVFRDD